MSASETCTPVATNCVYLVHKYYARSILFALFKKISYACSTNPHEHFNKIRTAYAKKRHSGFSCHSFGKQSLSGSRRTYKQHAFRNFAAQFLKLGRVFKKFNNLRKLFFSFLNTRNILKRCLNTILIKQLRAALPKRKSLPAPSLHLSHKKYPDCNKNNDRKPRHKKLHIKRRSIRRFCEYIYFMLP